jgi:hypothetical protein
MKHKGSDLKFCSCRLCRSGKHTKAGGDVVKATRRSYRRKVRQAIRMHAWEAVPDRAGVVYTD